MGAGLGKRAGAPLVVLQPRTHARAHARARTLTPTHSHVGVPLVNGRESLPCATRQETPHTWTRRRQIPAMCNWGLAGTWEQERKNTGSNTDRHWRLDERLQLADTTTRMAKPCCDTLFLHGLLYCWQNKLAERRCGLELCASAINMCVTQQWCSATLYHHHQEMTVAMSTWG